MSKVRKRRRVGFLPRFNSFKPTGASSDLEINLTIDELEALRLKDLKGLPQEKAAERLGISQPTFHRTLASARKKLADVLVNGKSIKISGGKYEIVQRPSSRST